IALPVYLIGFVSQHFIKFFAGNFHEAGMSNPCPVVPVSGFTPLIISYFSQSLFIGGLVGFDWDIRGHASHGKSVSAMTGLNARESVGAHERSDHSDLSAIRDDKLLFSGEGFDVAGHVIPTPAIQPGTMLA